MIVLSLWKSWVIPYQYSFLTNYYDLNLELCLGSQFSNDQCQKQLYFETQNTRNNKDLQVIVPKQEILLQDLDLPFEGFKIKFKIVFLSQSKAPFIYLI